MEPVVPKIAINDEDPWTPTISAGSSRLKSLQIERVSILKSIKLSRVVFTADHKGKARMQPNSVISHIS